MRPWRSLFPVTAANLPPPLRPVVVRLAAGGPRQGAPARGNRCSARLWPHPPTPFRSRSGRRVCWRVRVEDLASRVLWESRISCCRPDAANASMAAEIECLCRLKLTSAGTKSNSATASPSTSTTAPAADEMNVDGGGQPRRGGREAARPRPRARVRRRPRASRARRPSRASALKRSSRPPVPGHQRRLRPPAQPAGRTSRRSRRRGRGRRGKDREDADSRMTQIYGVANVYHRGVTCYGT
ncbi:hypothetical protein PAHAL_3G208500 [Panicum hallii]|uniref:Uncharacterized protein n=1 Tax=Panicum hallii TaxID=206008 RepID=A0A2T8KIW1_9POAL|nr:hypothetical protein PAHAL_3G208500 [Panicum hallii]